MTLQVVLRRVYDDPSHTDGTRVLVDRIWPRGIKKAALVLDDWNSDVAPSTELRRWYAHDPEKFTEFARRYRAELDTSAGRQALERLRDSVRGKRLTLLSATKDIEHSQAAVLVQVLAGDTD